MLSLVVWLSRKIVYCKIDDEYKPICNHPEECMYGEECMNYKREKNQSIWGKITSWFKK